MISLNDSLNWISTLGGPLILMEKLSVALWRGEETTTSFSDYDRASEITDYVGTLNIANRPGLVFAMPNETSVVRLDSRTVIFIRWIWAPSERDVIESLENFSMDQPWVDTHINVRFESDRLLLFDSAYAGDEVVDWIEVSLEPGVTSVSTFEYTPTEQINILLIKVATGP